MNRLEFYRKKQGIAQYEIAKTIGISTSTYCQYEKGRRMIPRECAEKIAKFLRVEVCEIFLPEKFTVSKSMDEV